jgi:hypothetical protein
MDLIEIEPQEIKELLCLSDPQGYFSDVLITQLTEGYRNRILHFGQIQDAIRDLSGTPPTPKSKTKKAEPFRRGLLVGLWHKHYFQTAFLAKNIQLEFSKGENFKQAFWRTGKKLGLVYGEDTTHEFWNHLIHEVVTGFYKRRARENNLTGEWIVYMPIDGRNYYLTLGSHGGDETVWANVQACFKSLPIVEQTLLNQATNRR